MNNNISFLRNMAIVSIVIHHSMSAFGGWPPNHAIGGEIPVFATWISGALKTLGLGVFSFISGYVLYYQKDKQESFWEFVIKKAKRILIPCIIWASVYGMFFQSYMFDDFPSPINGTHLWYLPMLFLGILTISTDLFTKKGAWYIILSWICFVILYKIIPIRTFSECFHYIPVIYLGYLCNKWQIKQRFNNWQCLLTALLGGVICLYITFNYIPVVGAVLQLAAYSFTAFIMKCFFNGTTMSRLGTSLSNNSFAIYLLHQFVINMLLALVPFKGIGYYPALLVIAISAMLFPWIVNVQFSRLLSK